MRYNRVFKLQAAHFNALHTYYAVWDWTKGGVMLQEQVLRCLADCHGHNFKIVVALEVEAFDVMAEGASPWIVDDASLTKLVMEWDNMNISMHPDFLKQRLRATTEAMAQVLFKKLLDAFGPNACGVRVYETEDIYAQAGDVP